MHRCCLVRRDIRSANVLVDAAGAVRLMGFCVGAGRPHPLKAQARPRRRPMVTQPTPVHALHGATSDGLSFALAVPRRSRLNARVGINPKLIPAACRYWMRKPRARLFCRGLCRDRGGCGADSLLQKTPLSFEIVKYHSVQREGMGTGCAPAARSCDPLAAGQGCQPTGRSAACSRLPCGLVD
jgi:hypothetical protein